jgi:serine/threonine protein kinase/tetratricopeptide (TPR) repeat protein
MTTADDRPLVEALVAECIEAMERGEPEPAARVCRERPHLLTKVQKRLAQLVDRGLLTPTVAAPAAIGPYRIVRELGSGGMGTVYLAEQQEPVRREVALKVVKLGMDTREVLARFAAERQALARMSHPHIAQVFDAGMTAEGRPYFVMEFVAGAPLTTFCDRRGLDTAARLALFTAVCRAVQHAHDRGFIHRDLKPSNVLVAEHEGTLVPKIIDFGIAKASTPIEQEQRTRLDQVLGTPEYMSPEQARSAGLDIDTRTDVYSLGTMLYELLCGELPFDSARLRRASWMETERILGEELPTAPSQRLAMVAEERIAARGGVRTNLRRKVAGELDWITLRALAKDREQRYPSPLAFAEDLERWLRNEPVLAAPPSRSYRLRKFVRRHRVAVTAALSVVLALAGGLSVSLAATVRAERARAGEAQALVDMRSFYGLARDAVGNLVDVADRQLVEVPQADAVRRRMLADAIAFYESLRVAAPRELALRIDIAAATTRLGVLQQRLGQTKDAVATLRDCVATFDALRREEPSQRRLAMLAIDAQRLFANALLADGQADAAKQRLRLALADLGAWRSRAETEPNEAKDRAADEFLAATLSGSLAYLSDEATEGALELFETSLAGFARAANDNPDARRLHAQTAARHAEALTRVGRLADAAAALAAALAHQDGLPAADSVELREQQAQLHKQSATVLRRLERFAEARQHQERAIAVYAALAAAHPDLVGHADNEAAGWHFLAQLEREDAQPERALASIRRAVAIRERLVEKSPQDHRQRARCVRSLLTQVGVETALATAAGRTGSPANDTLQRAAALAEALLAEHGDDVESLLVHAAVRTTRAGLATAQAKLPTARAEHLAVRDALLAGLQRWPRDVEIHHLLANCHLDLVRIALRSAALREAVEFGRSGLEYVDRGLAIDARHAGLREQAPQLASLLAAARLQSGDVEAGIGTLLQTLDTPAWGPEAQELAALLLAQRLAELRAHPQHGAWFERADAALRTAIANRGGVATALQRPVQQRGLSHTASRLRDLDLHVALAHLWSGNGDEAELAGTYADLLRLLDSMPDLETSRLREVHRLRAEWCLRRGDVAAAAVAAGRIQAADPEDPRHGYLAAVLLAKCAAAARSPGDAESHATAAVASLQQALANGMPAGELDDEEFDGLRRRADFVALRRR